MLQETRTIPIIFVLVADPVGSGFVASLPRPGGNATGFAPIVGSLGGMTELRFVGVEPEATGRPSYHPSVLVKLYMYGYLNRVQSSRRLEREAGRA